MKEMKMEMMKEMRESGKDDEKDGDDEERNDERIWQHDNDEKTYECYEDEENKYLSTKSGSLQDVALQMHMREQELVEVKGDDIEKMITDYLKKVALLQNYHLH